MTQEILGYDPIAIDINFMNAVVNNRSRTEADMATFVAMLTSIDAVIECGAIKWTHSNSIETERLYVRADKTKVGKLDQTCSPGYAMAAFGLGSGYVPGPAILNAAEAFRKELERKKADEIDPDAELTETSLRFDNITFASEVYPVENSRNWFEVSVTITGPAGDRMIGPKKIEVRHKSNVIGRALDQVGMGFERKSDEDLVFWWLEPNWKLADLMRSVGWKRVKPYGRF